MKQNFQKNNLLQDKLYFVVEFDDIFLHQD